MRTAYHHAAAWTPRPNCRRWPRARRDPPRHRQPARGPGRDADHAAAGRAADPGSVAGKDLADCGETSGYLLWVRTADPISVGRTSARPEGAVMVARRVRSAIGRDARGAFTRMWYDPFRETDEAALLLESAADLGNSSPDTDAYGRRPLRRCGREAGLHRTHGGRGHARGPRRAHLAACGWTGGHGGRATPRGLRSAVFLGDSLNTEQVQACCDQGVFTLTVPVAQRSSSTTGWVWRTGRAAARTTPPAAASPAQPPSPRSVPSCSARPRCRSPTTSGPSRPRPPFRRQQSKERNGVRCPT
jgi:hypothetical protein